jgi:hypothetical protein
MSVFNFYIPGNFEITQNAELYIADEVNIGASEYHFKIFCGNSLNQLFNTRTYQQNSVNAEHYDVNLTINDTYVNSIFTNVLNANGGTANNFIGMSTTPPISFSQRLLEIAALKIFQHAKARAAISNDNDFTDLHTHVTTHLATSFVNTNITNTFFEQYVLSHSIAATSLNSNDVDGPVQFNLDASQLFVYGSLSGSVSDGTPGTPATGTGSYNATIRIELIGY